MATGTHVPSTVCSGVTNVNSRYAMTRAQVDAMLTEISQQSFFDNVTLLFSEPIDNLISLFCFPFDVKSLFNMSSQTDDTLLISIVQMQSTGKYLGQLATPILDLGTKTISRHFNNFIDYAPYTKIELYLPFIGFVELDTDLVMGKTIGIKYTVDLYTGKCTAYVYTIENTVETIIMIRDGVCGMSVQIAGGSGAEISRNMLKIGIGAAASVVGLAAGAAGGAGVTGTVRSSAGMLGSTTVGALNAGKVDIKKSGTSSASSSAYGPMTAFLVYTRPVITEPTSYAHSYGRPSGKTATLSTLTGYTVVDAVHVEDAGFSTATEEEKRAVENLLKSGVIL